MPAVFFPLLFLLALLGAAWFDYLPVALVLAYLLFSLLTFVIYAIDKHAARRRQWRTPENTLHLLALLGGWPGAWLAQQSLRHKSSKAGFRWRFWLTVLINGGLLAGYVWLLRFA